MGGLSGRRLRMKRPWNPLVRRCAAGEGGSITARGPGVSVDETFVVRFGFVELGGFRASIERRGRRPAAGNRQRHCIEITYADLALVVGCRVAKGFRGGFGLLQF